MISSFPLAAFNGDLPGEGQEQTDWGSHLCPCLAKLCKNHSKKNNHEIVQ